MEKKLFSFEKKIEIKRYIKKIILNFVFNKHVQRLESIVNYFSV